MAVAEIKSKLKTKKFMEFCGVSLMFLALFLVAVRSFTIAIFDEGDTRAFWRPPVRLWTLKRTVFLLWLPAIRGPKTVP